MLDRVLEPERSEPALTAVVARLRSLPAAASVPLRTKRTGAEQPHVDDIDDLRADGFTVESVSGTGGVRALLATPPGSVRGTVVGAHGGGFVLCSATTHIRRFALIAAAAGCRALVVDYRLAPEDPFPAALDDIVNAARWAAGTQDGPVTLVGDSAGGGLVMAALCRLRAEEELGAVAAAVCISPWVDLMCSARSYATRRDIDPFAHLDDLPAYAAAYAHGFPLDDPALSPLHASLGGLPPVLVQIGSTETMYDEAEALAMRLSAAGTTVRFEEWVGMFHTWHAYDRELTGARDAIAAAGAWLARWLP